MRVPPVSYLNRRVLFICIVEAFHPLYIFIQLEEVIFRLSMWCHGMRWEKKKPPLPFIILMSAARVYILMRWYQSIWTWHRSVQPHNCVERQHRVTALFTIIYKLMMKCSSLDELIILKEHCFLIKQTISMISFQGSVMMKAYRNLFPPFYMFYCTVILGHEQV